MSEVQDDTPESLRFEELVEQAYAHKGFAGVAYERARTQLVKAEQRWLMPSELALSIALAYGLRLPRPIPILVRATR